MIRSLVVIPTLFASPDLLAGCLASAGPALVVSDGTFAENCNRGAQLDADVYVFLNDDTHCHPGWLEPLVDRAAQGWLAGPKLLYPDGRIQCAGVEIGMRDVLTAWNVQHERPAGPVTALTGACLAVPGDVWRALGGFDETFVNGYEDVDLCLRARALGAGCWYEPTSIVTHHESQSGPARWTHVQHNIRTLHERWGDQWQTLSTS